MNTDNKEFAAIVPIPEAQIPILLGIQIEAEQIIRVDFLPAAKQKLAPQTAIAVETVRQIKAYFSSPDWHFELPIRFFGTAFQQRVWRALSKIKPGQTVTYGDLAEQLNSSARAVGNACRRNPLPIIVPCHRVVSKSGLGGFSGQRDGSLVNLKQWLIKREYAYVD